MSHITHITQSESSIRMFCVGKPISFIEDWNKFPNDSDGKKKRKKKNQ